MLEIKISELVGANLDILDNIFDGLFISNQDKEIIFWNRGAELITGYPPQEAVGKICGQSVIVHLDEEGNRLCGGINCPIANTLRNGKGVEMEVSLLHKEGYRIPVNLRTMPMLNTSCEIVGVAEIFTEIPNKFAVQKRIKDLETLALLDPVTGIGNRRFAEAHLYSRLGTLNRYDISFGVIFADLDNFKSINDDYGHAIGDRTLKMVAQTFVNNIRSLDVAARWGGEEFIVTIMNAEPEALFRIAEKLRLLVQESFILAGEDKIGVTVSMGVAIAKNGDTIETLVNRADALMYRSKKEGKNKVSIEISPETD